MEAVATRLSQTLRVEAHESKALVASGHVTSCFPPLPGYSSRAGAKLAVMPPGKVPRTPVDHDPPSTTSDS